MEGVTSANFASLGPPVKKALAEQTSKREDEIALLWGGIAIRRLLQNQDSVTAEFIASSAEEMNSLANSISSMDDTELMHSISEELTSAGIVGVSITEIGEVTMEDPSATLKKDSSDEGPWYEQTVFIWGYVLIWLFFCTFVIVRHVLKEKLDKISYDFKKEDEEQAETDQVEIRPEGDASVVVTDNVTEKENKTKSNLRDTGTRSRKHSLAWLLNNHESTDTPLGIGKPIDVPKGDEPSMWQQWLMLNNFAFVSINSLSTSRNSNTEDQDKQHKCKPAPRAIKRFSKS